MSFELKVVLVTGASSGIGATTAEVFAQRGALGVVLVGRNAEKLANSEKKCRAANAATQLLVIKADVTLDTERIMNETIAKFGRLDILVNNAGIYRITKFMDSDVTELDAIMNTNLRSVHMLTKLAVPHLLKTKGNIVNVSSIAGLRTLPFAFNYCITKAALDQFTKCLAIELAPQGIRVNSVNPAAIETDIFENSGMTDVEDFLLNAAAKHPIGRIGTSQEVAKTIAFLASDDASFITGSLLAVDGGRASSAV